MASLRYAVNAYAAEDPDPGRVLTRLAALDDLAGRPKFATVLVCLLEEGGRRLHLASAGHLAPVVASPAGAHALDIEPGPPRGLGPHCYTTATVDLPPGATLLMFSDGLVERRDESIDTGVARLVETTTSTLTLEALLDRVLTSAPPERDDDTVICAFRARPKNSETEETTASETS
jgi:serine phosphatase RsbU (regulator of sigma subunit)